jgi:hypothetical protein
MQLGWILIFLSLFLPLPAWGVDPSGTDLGRLPGGSALPGWIKRDSPLLFRGSNLYGRINGGAELFLEFGFEELTVQHYRNGEEEVALELYRMKDKAAAMGIYLMKCGLETPDESFLERHTISRYQLIGIQDRYYFQLDNLEGKDHGRSAMLGLARELSSHLPDSKPWQIPDWFGQEGLVPGTLRIIRGTFSLEPIYTLGEGNLLQLNSRSISVAGRFQDSQGQITTRIVAAYSDDSEVSAAFRYLRSHLDSSISILQQGETEFHFKDFEGKQGHCARKNLQIEIRV